MPENYNFDFIVIGSGIAGLSFALKTAQHGTVAVITKKSQSESNTNYAQGGIAAVMDPLDSFEQHIQDTLECGCGLCNRDAVELMVKDAPDCINELIQRGVEFTREENGKLALGREGGHHANRVVHADDLTGKEIERAIVAAVKNEKNITVFENHLAIDLIIEYDEISHEKKCIGVYVFDRTTREQKVFKSKVILLSTGGAGRIYQHTTNPDIATGDGIAMAYRAGAKVNNLEFVQFHPTSLYHSNADSFLISEAVRGFGGILKLKDGTDFMNVYHPMGSLAPRDIVARAIETEMKKSGEKCVYLDVTHLDKKELLNHFPNIVEKCLSYGIDVTKEMIPVVPAAHYMCGGVVTDLNGRTTIYGLYSCGETACTGVHGANRLASNSLLEALVFAKRAAIDACSLINQLQIPEDYIPLLSKASGGKYIAASYENEKRAIQRIMSENVGITRSNNSLNKALRMINQIKEKIETMYFYSPLDASLIEVRNMALVSNLVIKSALARKESIGLHYNSDYPPMGN